MITVNGKNVELPHPMSVAEYLEKMCIRDRFYGSISVESKKKSISVTQSEHTSDKGDDYYEVSNLWRYINP